MANSKTQSAAERLRQVQGEIERLQESIAEARQKFEQHLTAGDDAAADEVAADIQSLEQRLAILQKRLPVLEGLAEAEDSDNRTREAERLTAEANERLTDLQDKFAAAVKAADQLKKASDAIQDSDIFGWYTTASRAMQSGGSPKLEPIKNMRQAMDAIAAARRRLIGLNESFDSRRLQI